MSEERTSILKMLAEGKITVEEAEGLLDALEGPSEKESAEEREAKRTSSWSMGDFGGMFGELFGEKGPFGKEGLFGKEDFFRKCFGAKHRTGKTGWKGARCWGEHREGEQA